MIGKARQILGDRTKITYGINYTDQYVLVGGQKIVGGEIEQWKFYLTETFTKPANQKHQQDMQALWNSLDVIGFDYYRALASQNEKFSSDYATLVHQLESRPQSHASQLDTALTEIALTLGAEKPAFIQEVGYSSTENTFLEPAAYESSKGKLNLFHQAAAWEAFLKAYWTPQWPWMTGFGMWQVLVDEETTANDKGFTPLQKHPIENVLQKYLL
jgi:roadblock/LC7 domain-containing protein